jgi:hypothetical protein
MMYPQVGGLRSQVHPDDQTLSAFSVMFAHFFSGDSGSDGASREGWNDIGDGGSGCVEGWGGNSLGDGGTVV